MAHYFGSLLLTVFVIYNPQALVTSDVSINDPYYGSNLVHESPVPYPEQQFCDDVVARKLCGSGSSVGSI